MMAQRGLTIATDALSRSMERLASGQRINKAADDAAGLELSASLKLDSRVFNQGRRNLNDGISYLSIADSALTQEKEILVRQKELASQALNGVYSNAQRDALDKEVSSLTSEYNRILEATSFNGKTIFQGDSTSLKIQYGYGTTASLEVQIGAAVSDPGASGAEAAATLPGPVLVSSSVGGTPGDAFSDSVVLSSDGRYAYFSSGAENFLPDSNTATDIFRKDLQTGVVTRLNVTTGGAEAVGGNSINPDATADGRYVVFESTAWNLVAGDNNGWSDIFMRDTQTNTTTRVSLADDESEANFSSFKASISNDGRYVAFQSSASNLVAGDVGGYSDIFVRDLVSGTTTLVSKSTGGTQGNANSTNATISGDGRYIVYESSATNLVAGDTNNKRDIFMYDIQSGTTTRVSVTTASAQVTYDNQNAKISDDGRYVVFDSGAFQYDSPADSNNQIDIFVRDTVAGTTTRVSLATDGTQGNNYSDTARISADGRYVLFESLATNLDGSDTNGVYDLFVHDTQTGETSRISHNEGGTIGNAASYSTGANFSGDGAYIAFSSDATNLVIGDTNGMRDVFIVSNPFATSGSGDSGSGSTTFVALSQLEGVSVATESAAGASLDIIDDHLAEIESAQSAIGASMNRLQATLNSVTDVVLNYTASASRITDVDVAEESSRMVRNQIRVSLSASILAQANLQPQLALRLLQP